MTDKASPKPFTKASDVIKIVRRIIEGRSEGRCPEGRELPKTQRFKLGIVQRDGCPNFEGEEKTIGPCRWSQRNLRPARPGVTKLSCR